MKAIQKDGKLIVGMVLKRKSIVDKMSMQRGFRKRAHETCKKGLSFAALGLD